MDSLWARTYKAQMEDRLPLRGFFWDTLAHPLYQLCRPVNRASSSDWSLPSCDGKRGGLDSSLLLPAAGAESTHGALALVLESSMGFTPWTVIEAVGKPFEFFRIVIKHKKSTCVEWNFLGCVPMCWFLLWTRVPRVGIKPDGDLSLGSCTDVRVSYCESVSSVEFNPSQWKCWESRTPRGQTLTWSLLLKWLYFFWFQYPSLHRGMWALPFRIRESVWFHAWTLCCQWKQMLLPCCVQPS